MPTLIRTAWLLMPVLFLGACGRSSTPDAGSHGTSSSHASPAAQQFPARLEAAKGILNTNSRDEALSKLANDAAREGDAAVTRQALQGILNNQLRDDAAAGSALKLAQRGQVKEATDVARLILSTATRDKTLAAIVKAQ